MAEAQTNDEEGWLNRQQGFYGEQLIITLAAAGGLSVSDSRLDLGFDVNLEASDGEIARLQVKTSRVPLQVRDGLIRFKLEVDAYNRLRKHRAFPTFLVIVEVPKSRAEWITCLKAQFTIRRRARYVSLVGLPETSNTSTVTVSLPAENMVTPEVLRAMVEGGL